jgi:hypothetical protein
MADAPTGGLYSASVDASVEGDRFEVVGTSFGPAGISAIEFPDGSIWEVDHLDPGSLVGLEVDAADPAASPLLIAAFGGDAAMRLVDSARESGWGDRDLVAEPFLGSRPTPAEGAGRLVLLADLAQDPSVDPVARLLSVVELAVLMHSTAGGNLFDSVLPELFDMAESLAADVDVTELPVLGMPSKRLLAMVDSFSGRFGEVAPETSRVLEALVAASGTASPSALEDRRARTLLSRSDALLEDAYLAASLVVPAEDFGGPEDFIVKERVTPSLLEVTVTRSGDERWARALRRDGLVLLAQAPFQRDGLMDRAELLVPPDTNEDEIEVLIVDADQLPEIGRRHPDLIRAAVRAGRAAASAERLRDVGRAMQRWRDCAALWAEAGDDERAFLARRRTNSAGGRFRGQPLLIDELDPYGDVGS